MGPPKEGGKGGTDVWGPALLPHYPLEAAGPVAFTPPPIILHHLERFRPETGYHKVKAYRSLTLARQSARLRRKARRRRLLSTKDVTTGCLSRPSPWRKAIGLDQAWLYCCEGA